MNYFLGKIKNITLSVAQEIMENEKSFFELQGIIIENIWQNVDDNKEIYFLAKIDNIKSTKEFAQKMRAATLLVTPDASVAELVYLSN
jgi:hypothetical protein